ncbi:EAL domain-containing protein [Egicoccus sp. AB-alg6-2]|uniref:EAL domain-containing protein n=1 Tax=Egicoccus sp. AB-alg6-2 TaxID=3242692 RepID=UPI00359E5A52
MAARALLAAVSLRPRASVVLVAALLFAQWALNSVFGAGVVVPHGYYLPVLFVALRFGHLAALATAAVAGLLAGPFTYQVVDSATHQAPVEWGTRLAYFLLIGQLAAWLARHARPPLQAAARLARDERELVAAIEAGRLDVHYQPVFDLSTGELRGYEALVRWDHPDGLRAPDTFLPVAEATGRMRQIGDVVLSIACEQAQRWRREAEAAGRRPPVLAVNLAAECVSADDLQARVERALRRSGLPAELLCVEVTEGAVVADLDGCARRLQALRERGVCVAIDDFGAGHAALSYLHRLPVDVIKLDRSFVAELEASGPSLGVVEVILALAEQIGAPVVAEGIETGRQQRLLARTGCHFGQGYHLGRPLPAGQLPADWLEQLPVEPASRPAVGAD